MVDGVGLAHVVPSVVMVFGRQGAALPNGRSCWQSAAWTARAGPCLSNSSARDECPGGGAGQRMHGVAWEAPTGSAVPPTGASGTNELMQ